MPHKRARIEKDCEKAYRYQNEKIGLYKRFMSVLAKWKMEKADNGSKRKYDTFPEKDRIELEPLAKTGLEIKDVKIKSPNNPADLLNAKLIKLSK